MTMRARILLSAAIVCLPLSPISRAAQHSSAIVVHVWKVGSPHRGDTPVPSIPALLVRVSDSLKAFQPTTWEYLIRTSKHYAEAKALATRPIDEPASFTIRAPFGVGRQPHRWRIWAVSARGDVARSEWRTLFYTN